MNPDLLTGVARAHLPTLVTDLSLGGAAMEVKTALQEGAIYSFVLDVGGEPVIVRAEVVRCRPTDPGPGYQIGIRFVGLDPKDERRILDYLKRPPS